MLIDLRELHAKYNMEIKGVLHVGAHMGEEAEVYDSLGIKDVTWVEANPQLVLQLRDRLNELNITGFHTVLQALISDVSESGVEFHVTNNFESSSMLEMGTHLETSPGAWVTHTLRLNTYTIDALPYLHAWDLMNLDIQGMELRALKGATERLSDVKYIYTEVNKKEVYKGCAKIEELDEFLVDFDRVETKWCEDGGIEHGWGDALWVRKDL